MEMSFKEVRSGAQFEVTISGFFTPSDVKEKVRQFAGLTESRFLGDGDMYDEGDPKVNVLIDGWLEMKGGGVVTLRSLHPVEKIGRKYFHVKVDGETLQVTRPTTNEYGYDPKVVIREAHSRFDSTDI